MAYVNYENPIKLIEGWLQHKNAQDPRWTSYWCVLKDYVIYIFKTQETSKENHIGVLSIGSDTYVRTGDSDQKKGYRFDLYTTKKLNKFKTTKFTERELWKAYIIGLAQGDIPDSIDLLAEQIQKVRSDVQRVMSRSTRPPLPITPTRFPPESSSVTTGFQSPTNSISFSFDTSSQTSMDKGGPTIRHRFWPNPEKTEVPSWFFNSITRDTAENILRSGHSYGNTLMRESVTFRDTGSYVITKKMEHSRGPPFNHFEVIRVSEGFKINVENAHKSMKCLSDVMEYFVVMSGSAVTRPMVTNDLKALGLDTPDYHTKIWKSSKNAESGEEDIEADYPTEAYEEPVTDLHSRGTSTNPKTWGPSSKPRRDSRQAATRGGGVTMGVGPGSRLRVTPDTMRHRVMAANVMHHLDTTLDTLSADNTPRQAHQSSGKEYYNDADIIDRLGPAPPPPCSLGRRGSEPQFDIDELKDVANHPRWHNRAKSVPNLQIAENLPHLNREVPVTQTGPGLVKPSKTPPRVLPKPPKEPEANDDGQHMTALQRQLQSVQLRPADKKPWLQKRNTWHQRPRQQLPSRSYSTSVAPDADIYQDLDDVALTKNRSYSESDDYYDDAVGLTLTEVSFDLGASPAPETNNNNDDGNSGVLERSELKKKLEAMIGGGGMMPLKRSQSMNAGPTKPIEPVEAEEEEYDEVIYESAD